LIFFVLALIIAGWSISNQVTEAIQGEAEINVYLYNEVDDQIRSMTIEGIEEIDGVRSVRSVDGDEAYARMEKVLGQDAKVLTFFDTNPFDPFLEIQINLKKINTIVPKIQGFNSVELVRDNKEVLDRLSQLSSILNLLSYLVLVAVGITTLVIMSHIIRQGVYHHREQINTLELLGAPKLFISLPFYIEGIMMTVLGGFIAIGLTFFVINQFYMQIAGPLPFIPLPSKTEILRDLTLMIMILSVVLGFVGSAFGIRSSREKT
jgi:cell division transport system permease protein